jgi:hypothetical protein
MARKVERMSEGALMYHRQWASTVASKASLSRAGGEKAEEVEEGEYREAR